MKYIIDLEKTMRSKGYSEKYISRCTNYARGLYNNKLPIIFDVKHLAKLMGIDPSIVNYYVFKSESLYTSYKISKKTGGYRTIDSPSLNLKKIQRWILDNVLLNFSISDHCYGFKQFVGILDNASIHVNKKLVYNIDLEDFFPSITSTRVFFLFYNNGYSSEISYALTRLMTYKNRLPQGAPTSPMLSNIICINMDKELSSFAKKNQMMYSRYADDITFSTNNIEDIKSLVDKIKKIIAFNEFEINLKKERFQFSNQPQYVTGLLVNNKVKIRRKFKKDVEKEIYFCEKYGISNHLKYTRNFDKSFFKEYLYGKVYFIKSIEPDIGEEFMQRLNDLNWSY
ncbi:retron St85 family RNA-directed DNA polymerase [Chryseomicrobium imtechense]